MNEQNKNRFPNNLTRREFIALTSICAGNILLSTSLAGCTSTSQRLSSASDFAFQHGVASGDPLKDGFILWTRATPLQQHRQLVIGWEVSEDNRFKKLVRSGTAIVDQETDFTLKVDVRGLQQGQQYYYRFVGNNSVSDTGRCKTLPTIDVKQVNFIVCSCANYPAGFFHAYEDAARNNDIDAVLHLGDYLYEYGMGQYGTEHAKEIGRELPKGLDTEMVTLESYRLRYGLYRSDTSLQKLHAAAAFIHIWDDHEIANDTWREGAQNHNLGEGEFSQRKFNAIKAWYEWLPVRVVDNSEKQKIYRSFDFGNLISLHMLDTRVIARDKQLNVADYKDPITNKIDNKKFNQDLSDSNRVLIGNKQFLWLQQKIEDSNSKWQLIGQQVLMGKMLFPAELAKYRKTLGKVPKFLNQLAALKKNQHVESNPLSKTDQQRLNRKAPYNMDAWDGYPAEREKLFSLIKRNNKNLLVIAGDTHNAWSNTLVDNSGSTVGMEFAVQSITSPGMEKYLKMDATLAQQTANSLCELIDDLNYCNLHQRGYLKLTIKTDEVKSEWVFIDSILEADYKSAGGYTLLHTPSN